jgi:hypothetical protein
MLCKNSLTGELIFVCPGCFKTWKLEKTKVTLPRDIVDVGKKAAKIIFDGGKKEKQIKQK